MTTNKTEYRRNNGKRLEGRGLAARVAKEVNGMMLAQAFIVAKSAGFALRIAKHDGVPRQGMPPLDSDHIEVEVAAGLVKKSWAA